MVDEEIAGDPKQPRAPIPQCAESFALRDRPQENLLQQVFGFVPAAGAMPQETGQLGFVLLPGFEDAVHGRADISMVIKT